MLNGNGVQKELFLTQPNFLIMPKINLNLLRKLASLVTWVNSRWFLALKKNLASLKKSSFFYAASIQQILISPFEIFHYFINHFFSKCRVFISYAFFMPFWQIYWCLFWNKTLSKYLYDESESYILANILFLPFFLIIQLYNCDLRQSLTSFADFVFTQCTQKLVYKTKKGPRKISLSRLWHV